MERDFTAARPNTHWVADLTEFTTREGKLHLAGILDLYSNRVVGWSMSERRTAELAVDALGMAIKRRRPDAGVVHHADHGSQREFNRSLQHRFVDLIVNARSTLRPVCASRGVGDIGEARPLKRPGLTGASDPRRVC